ncbi:uncharacterized protein LOC126248700 [Schistocerca nitens]|uniref:uncharacterized protein LOC126248700 n=1 Tax=Schistocerca nitens TaxID=7011 RepID=UPI002118D868|nr:uncharacterized protein LOC126248700 [Schistocerca nitens]
MFADDTNILFSNHCLHQLNSTIADTNCSLVNWLNKNKLLLNKDKTVYIDFHLTQKVSSVIDDIRIENVPIQQERATKFLGVWIDDTLQWDIHKDKLLGKMKSLCYAFSILSKISDIETLKCALVHSIITYFIPFWGFSHKNVFIMQKRIIKTMKQVPLSSTTKHLFKELSIMPVPCIYIHETVCFIQENLHIFTKNRDFHYHSTRHSNDIFIADQRLHKGHSSVRQRGVLLYKKLLKMSGLARKDSNPK